MKKPNYKAALGIINNLINKRQSMYGSMICLEDLRDVIEALSSEEQAVFTGIKLESSAIEPECEHEYELNKNGLKVCVKCNFCPAISAIASKPLSPDPIRIVYENYKAHPHFLHALRNSYKVQDDLWNAICKHCEAK